jgi:hypothetical protein
VVPHAQWAAVVHPDDLPDVEAGLRDAVARKCDATFEFRITRADGTTGVVTAVTRVVLDDRGTVIRVIGADMDVTRAPGGGGGGGAARPRPAAVQGRVPVARLARAPLAADGDQAVHDDPPRRARGPDHRRAEAVPADRPQERAAAPGDDRRPARGHPPRDRQAHLRPDSVFIRDAVVDALDTLEGTARAKGITLSADAHPRSPPRRADPTRLRQILIILLDNAVKFTPAGGSVEVRVGLLPHDPHSLLVEVHDTGCGIDPAITDRIFERLYQVAEPDRAGRKGSDWGSTSAASW